jgi:hypothetical protein
MPIPSRHAHVPQRFTIKVGDAECVVRATSVWPIPEVLELESQLEPGSDESTRASARELERELIADVLASRMIVPPRPRRRHQRAVSSRAVFYAGSEG